MVETLSPPNATLPDRAADEKTRADKQGSNPVERGIFSWARDIGHNSDLVSFQGRVKDFYKVGESAGVLASFISKALSNAWNKVTPYSKAGFIEKSTALHAQSVATQDLVEKASYGEKIQKLILDDAAAELNHDARESRGALHGKRTADGINFLAQYFIAKTASEVESEKLMRVYEKSVQRELGITTTATRDDLKRSTNPIIKNSVDYYTRKDKYRMVPVWTGLLLLVPLVVKNAMEHVFKIPNAEATKLGGVMKAIEKFSGIDASLGGTAIYYGWYFTKRQKGAFYQLDDIWDQTEGVTTAENRTINRGVNPGTLVTSEKITKLYDEVAKEQNLPAFKVTDPLTNRIFDQIARYLNHHYQSDLYRVKMPDPLMHEELKGSHFSHADLITLFGNKAVDINDAYTTALRLETLARTDIAQYRRLDATLAKIERPIKSQYAAEADFAQALEGYLGKLDQVGTEMLGSAWPANYIRKEIRPAIPKSYGVAPTILPPEMRFAAPNKSTPLKPGTQDTVHESPDTIEDASMKQPVKYADLVPSKRPLPTPAERYTEKLEAEPANVLGIGA